ncbi:phosphatidate cytidylyltransferase [Desulfolutivibrio sp.]|uniref:phosphatidate cytidylyltransferase n=1 Tax=Desulfolutivibrio sp. TaxID=2773296 RepID=UPI002F965200
MIPRSHGARLLTTLLVVPVVVATVLAGDWVLFSMVFVVSVLGLREFFAMRVRPGSGTEAVILTVIGTVLAFPLLSGFRDSNSVLVLGVLLGTVWIEKALFLLRFGVGGQGGSPPGFPGVLVSGLLYIPCALGFFLRFGPPEIFFVISAVAVSDAGAYYCGSLIGGPKLWSAVSPKKTWAGGLGGLVLCVGWCLLYGSLWGQEVGAMAWIWLAAGLNVAAQGGDFYESALKRVAGIKDSGRLLPGHGGILDRMDGLLPAILVYAWVSGNTLYFV